MRGVELKLCELINEKLYTTRNLVFRFDGLWSRVNINQHNRDLVTKYDRTHDARVLARAWLLKN